MRWCLLCGVWLACFATMSSAYGQGFLLPSVASGRMKHRPFVLQRHSVDVVVRGRMAHTTITQVYSNPASVAQQAQYVFSFPKGAVVSRFSLVINGKAQAARLMGRAKANRIYLSIVRRLKDPGILEQMGGGLYRLRVFPIPAGGSRRLQVSFVHMLPLFGRVIRYHYPLRLLRRQVAVARFVKLRIRWRAKRPLLRLYSPTHATTIRRINRHQIEATLYKENLSFARDLLLYASVSGNKLGVSLLAHRAPAAFQKKRTRHKGHFMLSIHPNLLHRTQQMTGKTVTFVVDTSGSMAAENRMMWAKKALLSCLSKLHPNDSINVRLHSG